MQIQKLVYVAYGWNLAINGQSLVNERPQAWDNGPVFRSIWDHIKNWGYSKYRCMLADPFEDNPISADLSPNEEAVIDHVWRKYGHMTGHELSQITHKPDTPWSKAYFGRGQNSQLDPHEVREHYVKLAMAGRERQATS